MNESIRLDVWLDVACLFKTRSEAQKACKLGKVIVNGQIAKPHREIRQDDRLIIQRPLGRKQLLTVHARGRGRKCVLRALRNAPASLARSLRVFVAHGPRGNGMSRVRAPAAHCTGDNGRQNILAAVRAFFRARLIPDPACGAQQWFHPFSAVDAETMGVASEHTFTGASLGTKWSDPNKRSAFFGTFSY